MDRVFNLVENQVLLCNPALQHFENPSFLTRETGRIGDGIDWLRGLTLPFSLLLDRTQLLGNR